MKRIPSLCVSFLPPSGPGGNRAHSSGEALGVVCQSSFLVVWLLSWLIHQKGRHKLWFCFYFTEVTLMRVLLYRLLFALDVLKNSPCQNTTPFVMAAVGVQTVTLEVGVGGVQCVSVRRGRVGACPAMLLCRESPGVGSWGHGLHVGVDLGPQEGCPVPVSGVPRVWALLSVSPDGVSGTEQTRLPMARG